MQKRVLANFEIDGNQSISGIYEPSNKNKKFTLWSNDYMHIEDHSNIYGKTAEGKHVSLIDCLSHFQSHSGNGERKYKSEVDSHTLIIGDEYVNPNEASVEWISIKIANPTKLIEYSKSFGYILAPRGELVDELNKQEYNLHFEGKENSLIAYFDGEFNILERNTHIGHISIENQVSHGFFGGPSGVHISNTVFLRLRFHSGKTLEDSFDSLNYLTKFIRLIGGSGLFFEGVSFKQFDSDNILTVRHDSYDWGQDADDTSFGKPLVDIDTEDFAQILCNWLAMEDRKVARNNFYNTYFQNIYTSDRLISSANVFDIFPGGNAVRKASLPTDLAAALERVEEYIDSELDSHDEARERLKRSIKSISRPSRITLKDRINERLSFVGQDLFEFTRDDLRSLVEYGIKVRKYFVHGTKFRGLSVEQLYEYQGLFIQFFEYVYAVSELIECGWKPQQHSMWFSEHRLGWMKKEVEHRYKRFLNDIQEYKE